VGFFFADLSPGVPGVDTLYVADEERGLLKFSLVGASWNFNGVVGTAADDYRGLTGIVTGNSVALYATILGGTGFPTFIPNGGQLVTITDSSGWNGAFSGTVSMLASVFDTYIPPPPPPLFPNQVVFRGITRAPNAAPVLLGANNFATIQQNDVTNPGTLVSALIAGQVTDANANPRMGIAITALNEADGIWQFSTNGGTSWAAVGPVSNVSALLLTNDANTRLRFVPNAGFVGTVTPGVSFRAWDQTSGVAGTKVDTSVNGGGTAFSTATASSSISVVLIDLEVVSNTAPATAFALTSFDYTIVARNNGPIDARGLITLNVPLDPNTTFVSVVTPAGWTAATPPVGSTGTVTFTRTGWTLNASDTFTITVFIPGTVADGTVLSSTATIVSPTTDPTPGDNSQTAITTVINQSDLEVVSDIAPATANAGANFTYTITAQNNGPVAVGTATLSVPLDPNTTFVSVVTPAGWSVATPAAGSSGTVIFTRTSWAAGASDTFTITVSIPSNIPAGTVLASTATITGSNTDPTPGNNSQTAVTTVTTLVDLVVTKIDSPDPVRVGEALTYTITVRNDGPSDATAVVLTDVLPLGATVFLDSVSSSQGSTSVAGNTLTALLGRIAAGGSANVIVVLHSSRTGILTNTATVTASEPEANPANNTATQQTTVIPALLLYAVGSDAGVPAVVNVYFSDSNVLKFSVAPFGAFTGGARVAVGDVNADGVLDLIVGAGPGAGPQVSLYDGRNGQLITAFYGITPASFTGGVYVAAGDLDGDGFADIIVGADAGGGPQVNVFSGATGAILRAFNALAPGFSGGVRVGTGDVDGDGRADIITGAGPGALPQVTTYRFADLAVISSFWAFPLTFRGGVYVAGGDLNGDGVAEIVAGAGPGGLPQVTVFGGPSRALLGAFFGGSGIVNIGGSGAGAGVRVGVTGANGRGVILTGPGPGTGPTVRTFDGATFSQVSEFFAFDPLFPGGIFVGG